LAHTAARDATCQTAPVHVGGMRVTAIIDGSIDVPAEFMFPTTSAQDWAPHRDLLTADGLLPLPMGGFLVESGDRRVLVDAGCGEPMPMEGFGRLLDNLRATGVEPTEITDVVFTHLHFDHVGWATGAGGEVVFPNATYRCHAADLEFFFSPDLPEVQTGKLMGASISPPERLAPIRERIAPFSGDETIAPGIDVRSAPGHTPGSTVVVLSSGTERCLLLGDVVHCPVELVDLEWQALGDVDRTLSRRTREFWMREVEGGETPVAAAHFPGMQFGRLLRGEGGRTFTFL
jgi:glyoxylase-like metal-dependent hydrolase (beta-lactamase superfamily II)